MRFWQQPSQLSYAVRIRVVLKYLGQLCLAVAGLIVVPAAVALLFGEFAAAGRFALMAAALGTLGALLARLPASSKIQTNEAMVIAALAFLLASLVMVYPLTSYGLPFIDALFEAVSGVTTTGLSTTATVEDKPYSFLFARAWAQWFGGLGIVVLSLALAMRGGQLAKRLSAAESEEGDLVGGTKAHARRVCAVYGLLTVIGIAVLWISGAGLFGAIAQTLAAVSTGGFATHDDSVAHLGNWVVRAWLIVICAAGALPLAGYYRAWRRGVGHLLADRQLWALLCAGVAATALILAVGQNRTHASGLSRVGNAAFLAFSAQTTAGFSTTNPAQLDPASKGIVMICMLAGGASGSTAGGLKLLRVLIVIRVLHLALLRTSLTRHTVSQPRLAGRRLEPDEIQQAALIIVIFGTVIGLSWIPFLAAGYDPLDSLFEVVSAAGTVGLSAGVTGPQLPALLKLVLCIDMLMGRLEVLALLVILYPRTWIGKRSRST